jgi:hypothetical protein
MCAVWLVSVTTRSLQRTWSCSASPGSICLRKVRATFTLMQTVFELERETKRGRERAVEEKERRKELEDAKRKQLKAAMLKQLAGKLKASHAAAAKPG